MNDIRRTILWVIFGFLHGAAVGPMAGLQRPQGDLLPLQHAVRQGTRSGRLRAGSRRRASSVPAPQSANTMAGTPGAVPAGAPALAAAATKERVVVNTDVLALTFDSEGGTLVHSAFVKYKDQVHKEDGFVLLDESANRVYVAQTGLIGSGSFPTHKTLMTLVPGDRSLKDGLNELEVKFESADKAASSWSRPIP
jgi:YidC/Oxa1 family membrane protein insertase